MLLSLLSWIDYRIIFKIKIREQFYLLKNIILKLNNNIILVLRDSEKTILFIKKYYT
jgi:hypothetical protein